MPWIDAPTQGWIAGTVQAPLPDQADGVTIKIKRTGFPLFRRTRKTVTDGNGYFGFTKVTPGRYRIWTDGGSRTEVTVSAGAVARATPITSKRASNCQLPTR
jgi:hypothetical protein